MADKSSALFDGNEVSEMMLCASLDGRVVKCVVFDEGFGSVAEK